MKYIPLAGILLVTTCSVVTQVLADATEELCMECHEPAEDWEGLSSAEILTAAQDASVKRHKDNRALSEEQLKAIIAKLLPTPE